jgi:hypothetical protein
MCRNSVDEGPVKKFMPTKTSPLVLFPAIPYTAQADSNSSRGGIDIALCVRCRSECRPDRLCSVQVIVGTAVEAELDLLGPAPGRCQFSLQATPLPADVKVTGGDVPPVLVRALRFPGDKV